MRLNDLPIESSTPIDPQQFSPLDAGSRGDRSSWAPFLHGLNKGNDRHEEFGARALRDADREGDLSSPLTGTALAALNAERGFGVRSTVAHDALSDKLAVGEFADNVGLIENWANSMQHRSAAFDFPLHFALKFMCNDPSAFSMASLDHVGLAGVDPQGAVTFVENHDIYCGGVGGPIVRNKLLAYAYILTSEGYPAVFYRDYSTDPNCFGLKEPIDRLIQIDEALAQGSIQQRRKDDGVFAFERMGGGHLLVGLNKDENATTTITVQTGFPANSPIHELTGNRASVVTGKDSQATIVIPKNINRRGYVCYAHTDRIPSVAGITRRRTQEYEGAADLNIKPAVENERVSVCRLFVAADTTLFARFSFDAAHWTPATSIVMEIETLQGRNLLSHKFSPQSTGSSVEVRTLDKEFHSMFVTSSNTPPDNKAPGYKAVVSYTAPVTL